MRLWSSESQIDPELIDYLYEKYPEESYSIIKEDLKDTGKYFMDPEIVKRLIRIGVENDRAYTIKKMTENIIDVNVHVFKIYGDLGCEIKDPLLKEAFKKRMKSDDNMHIDNAAEKALACY